MPMYEFTLTIAGYGDTPEDAWDSLLDDGMFYFPDGDYSMPEEYRNLDGEPSPNRDIDEAINATSNEV